MKRTPLRRTTPLARTSRLRPRSGKRAAEYVARRKFVRDFLAGRQCEARDLGGCFGAMTVHEAGVKRSHGGAIVPGPKADAQGQHFMAMCSHHNGWVEDHPAEARRRGWA